jgi:hypothetical protein
MDNDEHKKRLRHAADWVIIIGATVLSVCHFSFIIWEVKTRNGWLDNLVKNHYPAIIVMPSYGFASLCLILLLDRNSKERIKFKAFGFEFDGASAPIILWIASFLACACVLRLTWPLT